ncbi:hypothetical protein BSZ22_28030 [Bradyrhizobium canariense]|uniref:Uncharacterized protein n=2 Tax=Bradyrhizobium canariense TaxID=255045 RepID=A0A1X3E2H7_9BRAD|nr:hypothetical protein BST65_23435 [Bradyrhizobium canariense]OSI30111.1 hypothetical protein BST66_24290 [Bradyrhizobium canariense]OSI38422.1 hypothetical protein BSZ20_36340 [Bradyrhizobium canariense]OSI46769.1 hypothetical protein BST67_23585 [Bradyrhizobium canariense]OSI50806.1 hypothetical protein BSZ15_32075 [Bradyrhizobium canariense]
MRHFWRNTQVRGRRNGDKIFLFIRIRIFVRNFSTRPKEEGRIAIVTNAGRTAVDVSHIGANGFAGRLTVSEGVAHTTGAIGVRQNRVVLTPGVCASSVAVMWVAQPGTRISHPQGDGGNSASLPGESTT